MNYLKNILYCFRYDLIRNRWLSGSRGDSYYGISLMFHHVTDEPVDADDCCKCSISDFKSIIQQYKFEGFTFVSMEEALSIIKNKEKKRFVIVTFDDIPDNIYFNAYPLLKDESIPFTVFITTSFIGKGYYVTKTHLKELSDEPLCTIGAHTVTHPFLRDVQNSKWEIAQSKADLECIINKPVRYFAYPYGRYSAVSDRIIKETREAGFDCAFCTISAPITTISSTNIFFLPRVVPVVGNANVFNTEWSFVSAIRIALTRPIKWLLNT